MKRLHCLTVCALLCTSATASAEILLVDRVRAESAAMPARGANAADVESRFGAPSAMLQPRGGQRSQRPPITRWAYPAFTAYFEGDRVIDVVSNRSHPEELEPKPPIR